MKLEYNILWIDNDLPGYIERGEVTDIEDFLTENGFEPNIEKVFDEADLDQFIDKHKYDLIISDFNLENTTGGRVIERIRNEKQLDTEILFYTAQASNSEKFNEEVRSLAFVERLTFQLGRDDLMTKIEKVITLTLKKLLELNATRGLITAATSDLDVEIEEIVMQLVLRHKIDENGLKQIVTEKAHTPLQRRLESFWDKYNDFQSYFPKIDAVKKWEIFRDLLRPLKAQHEIKSFLDSNRTYQVQVIDIRNKFAHAKAVDDNGTLKLKGQIEGEDFEFTEESCVKIRRNLIEHKRNIETLKNILKNS
jgi:CheY-like chemotaxis protein